VSCYTRHLSEIMAAAGVENSKENRKKIDLYLKAKFKMPNHMSSCPEVWKEHVKPMIAEENDRLELIEEMSRLFGDK